MIQTIHMITIALNVFAFIVSCVTIGLVIRTVLDLGADDRVRREWRRKAAGK